MTSMPEWDHGRVRAPCPGCDGKVSTFMNVPASKALVTGLTMADQEKPIAVRYFDDEDGEEVEYRLLACTMCGEIALAKIAGFPGAGFDYEEHGALVAFYPPTIVRTPLPEGVPSGVVEEIREAEVCASARAFRAAVIMLRSALEKLFGANGYGDKTGKLWARIEAAAKEGMITASDAARAHGNVRDLGNIIVHEERREVSAAEWEDAIRYAKRIVDCFYDHRPTALALLVEKGRMKAEGQPVDA